MAVTVEMRTQVSQLYVALFGRAPDGEGLGFWVQQLSDGKTMTQVADIMYATEPARAYYPNFSTNEEIISKFYTQVLGRTADTEGLAFWTAKLNAPGATPGSVITEMVDVVANYTGTDPAGVTSAALFNNRAEVAQWYGEQNGAVDGATTILVGVTSDPATATAAMSGSATSGSTFTLTANIDNIQGTAGNDTIIGGSGSAGAASTLGSADVINGGAGIDTLKIAPVLQDWLNADLSRHGIPLSAIYEAQLLARLSLSRIAFSQRSTNETWLANGTPLTPPTLFRCEIACTGLIRTDEVAYSASYADREEWPPHWPAA